jgi:hypothetical protein
MTKVPQCVAFPRAALPPVHRPARARAGHPVAVIGDERGRGTVALFSSFVSTAFAAFEGVNPTRRARQHTASGSRMTTPARLAVLRRIHEEWSVTLEALKVAGDPDVVRSFVDALRDLENLIRHLEGQTARERT